MPSCAACGGAIAPDDRFCAHCGLPLAAEAGIEHTGSITSIIQRGDTSGTMPVVGSGERPDLPAGQALLVVTRGPGEGTDFALHGDVVTIGRAPESEVFLDDVTVSRRHAELRRGAEGWSIRDAGSLNGTYVNRRRVDDAPLRAGDEVQIGKFRFAFVVGTAGS